MLQNPCKTLGFKKNMVYKIPPGGGGKPYPASGLKPICQPNFDATNIKWFTVPYAAIFNHTHIAFSLTTFSDSAKDNGLL